MRCDIVMAVHDQIEYTKECVESVQQNTRFPHRIIIVDDASKTETAVYLDQLAESGRIVLLRNPVNLGWVGTVNKGLESSDAEYVCVMNNDTRVFPGWLDEMVRIAESNEQIGVVNPSWQLPRGCRMKPEVYFKQVVMKQQGKYIEMDWARGFCFLIKRRVIEKIGGLDDLFAPVYYDDWDYSIRAITEGFTCVRAEGAFVWHYGNVTYEHMLGRTKLNMALIRKKEVFEKKWGRSLRIGLFIDKFLEKERDAIHDLTLRLLRDQNRLEVTDGIGCFDVRHINCRVKRASGGVLTAMAVFSLLSNLRCKKDKRYDAIICSARLRSILSDIPFVKDSFNIWGVDPDGAHRFDGLLDAINKIKHQPR